VVELGELVVRVNELEKRLEDRFRAQERAIEKQEGAQAQYNQTHNDLLRKMDEQAKQQMPRQEIEARLKYDGDNVEHLRVRITDAEKSLSSFKTREVLTDRKQDMTLVYVGLLISFVLALVDTVTLIVYILRSH
jgi:chromosome segregation ATPase